MSINNVEKIVGLSVALVDCKVHNHVASFPSNSEGLIDFIEEQTDVTQRAGAPIPNALVAYLRVADNPSIQLSYRIGDDEMGRFYAAETQGYLGLPQIDSETPTGIWVGVYEGNKVQQSAAYFGASRKTLFAEEHLFSVGKGIFITDVFSCQLPLLFSQAGDALVRVKKEGGIFVFSLGGAASKSISDEVLESITTAFAASPHIAFGNTQETLRVAKSEEINVAVEHIFPETRLFVSTQGEFGSFVRFEGEVIDVPPYSIPRVNFIDEEGAGDCYLGVFLGMLTAKPYFEWKRDDVVKAAETASFAASLVLQSFDVRLSESQAKLVADFARNLTLGQQF